MKMVERYLNSSILRTAMLVLVMVEAALLTIGLPGRGRMPYRIDLDVYRTGAQVFLDGGALYGSLPELSRGMHLPFTYPPIAAALFTIFAVMPLWLASTLLTIVSILCIAVVLRIVLGQTCDRPRAQLWWLVAPAMAVGLWFGPVRETLAFGQVNAVLMAFVVVAAVRGRGRWWGGMLIGLAIAIKLTPAVFLLLLFLRRDWRGAGSTVLAFLACTGVGHILMPDDSMEYWTHALADTARIGDIGYASNQSIDAVLYRFGLDGVTLTLAWLMVSLLVGLVIAWVAGRLLAHGHDTAATVTVGFVALFCSPVSWGHHWVWSLPLVVLMVVWAVRNATHTARWWWLSGIGTAVFLARPQWWLPHGKHVELEWTMLQLFVASSSLVWSLIALVAVGLSAHRLGEGDRNAPSPRVVLCPGLIDNPQPVGRPPRN